MSLIRVLGLGSPFGDDQLGWKVAEKLKKHYINFPELNKNLSIDAYDRPGLGLLELFQDAKVVFLIDAMTSEAPLGTILCFKNETIYTAEPLFSTHGIGVSEVLEWGNSLNLLPEELILYGVVIKDVYVSASLSKPVRAAIGPLTMQIAHEIQVWLKCLKP